MINRSLSVYRGTQSLIPGAYTVEQNVGLPLASMLSRMTGVEGGIRWALQPRRRNSQGPSSSRPDKADVEVGMGYAFQFGPPMRRSSGLSEQLPAYDDHGRSPPYQEQQLVPHTRDGQTPPGWGAQLVISTSGLGIAMSEESLRSLRYCLSWLRWANERLGGVVVSVKAALNRWEESRYESGMPDATVTVGSDGPSQAVLASRIQELKAIVLQTLKQVVEVVSNYAGGALPENARHLVHRHITSLPMRFRLASSMSSDEDGGDQGARRVMMLAQEGLNMMGQVSGVVNDTLVSAESWCEKLGRQHGQQQQHHQDRQVDLDGAETERINASAPVEAVPLTTVAGESATVLPSAPSSAASVADTNVDTDMKMGGT
jgi:transcriptional repressor OPI1